MTRKRVLTMTRRMIPILLPHLLQCSSFPASTIHYVSSDEEDEEENKEEAKEQDVN
jgi:hypothetical protein